MRMRYRGQRLLAVIVLAVLVLPAFTMEPSQVAPSSDDAPVLTIVRGGERIELSLAEIESLDLYDAEIKHFEGVEGVFTGVRLREFLREHGLDEARRVRFIAADDYTIFLEPGELAARDFMMVTRFEGEPVPRTALGPLMLIVPDEEEDVLAGEAAMTKWIWSVIEIRAR